MVARWASFGVGIGLLLAPLLLGYGSAGAILHDVAFGTLACVTALAALAWPRARLLSAAPAVWLLLSSQRASEPAAAAAEAAAGLALLALSLVPGARRAARAAAPAAGAAGARAGSPV